jgi:O-antigen/teichoic acid export membrane protein
MNRTSIRLATLNYATGLLYSVVTMGVGLITTPIIQRWLGTVQFGAVRPMSDLLSYLLILELGLGSSFAPLLVRAIGRSDKRNITQIVSAGIRLYLVFSIVIILIGLCLTPLVPQLVKVGPSLEYDLRLAWLISLLAWLPFCLSPFRWLCDADERGYQLNLVLIAQSILSTALALVLAGQGWGIHGQALSQTISTILGFIAIAFFALRKRPELATVAIRVHPEKSLLRSLWSLSIPTTIVSLTSRISYITDYLVISSILGAGMVPYLFLTQRLAVLAQGQLQSVGVATWAALAGMHARGEHETYRRRVVELTALVTILGVAVLGPIFAYDRHFIRLWVGSNFYAGDLVILAAVVNGFMLGIFSLWNYCFTSTGQIAVIAPGAVVSAIINLMLSIVFAHRFGLVGPLLGTTAALFAVNAWYLPLMMRRRFNIGLRPLLGWAIARPLSLGIPYVAALWWLAHHHEPYGWLGLAVEMGGSVFLFLFVGGRVLLTPAQRELLTSRIAAKFRRPKPTPDTSLELATLPANPVEG